MSRLTPVDLDFPIGVLTESTDRGAGGRWKDSDKIRFRKGMPEKLGGWVISSFGTISGDIDTNESNTDYNGASSNYSATDTQISMDSNITVADGDPVWLFGDSVVGGLGGRTIASGGSEGSFLPVASANLSAVIGSAIFFEMPEEFSGTPASITAGGATGDKTLTLDSSINTYLRAGTIVTIALQAGGFHHTTLESTLAGGATTITLSDPLPSAATAASSVQIWAAGSEYIDFANDMSYIIRFLGHAVSTDTQLILTEALPEDVAGVDIDVRPFQLAAADGAQSASATLDITPAADFTITANATFPDGFIILPTYKLIQERFAGFCRALHDWSDLSDQQWLAIGTDVKLYITSEDVLFDITPLRASSTLTDPFDTTANSREILVTDSSHGAQVGDYVDFIGSTAVGGLSLDGQYVVQTVPTADTYTIMAAYPALSTATGGGTVTADYDIAIGRASSQTVSGWGTGAYGGGLYGIGSVGVGVELPLRIWSLDNFGEDLLASPNGSTLYHWDRDSGPTIRAVRVDNAPASIQRMLVSPQARHVIAFGSGTGSNASPGDPDKLFIRWADQENFDLWIPASTNLAGDLRLDVGSEIITAIESRGDIIIFTDESLHALNYIGGEFVFALRHLGQSITIIGPNAGVDVNGIVYAMCEDDFLIYDGVLQVMPCEVRNHVFDDLNREQGDKVFASVNKSFTEIWWHYPSASSEVNDRYVKYNYKDKCWDFGTMTRTAFHDSSRFLGQRPYGTYDGLLFKHETGVDETDSNNVIQPMTSYLESGDSEISQSGSQVMFVGALIPDFKTLVGSVDVTLKGKGYPQRSSYKEKGPYTITSLIERQSVRLRSRQVAIRIESDALGDNWRMGVWRAEMKPNGRRGR